MEVSLTSPLVNPLHFLHDFSRRGDLEAVQEVLSEHPGNLNTLGTAGMNALHQACAGGHLPVVEYLVSMKADVNSQSSIGDTVLHIAASRGYSDVVLYLVNNTEVDTSIRNKAGQCAEDIADSEEVKMALKGYDSKEKPKVVFANEDEDSE